MKNYLIIGLILFSFINSHASEYYGLLVGYNSKGDRIMVGTCRSYPLNYFIEKLNQKEKLVKYFPQEKLNYLNFKVLNQTDSDDFYYKKKKNISKKELKDPIILRKYLTNLYFLTTTKRKELLKEKIFNSEAEIEEFICPLLTLVGVLETFSENNCVKVTWVAKLY